MHVAESIKINNFKQWWFEVFCELVWVTVDIKVVYLPSWTTIGTLYWSPFTLADIVLIMFPIATLLWTEVRHCLPDIRQAGGNISRILRLRSAQSKMRKDSIGILESFIQSDKPRFSRQMKYRKENRTMFCITCTCYIYCFINYITNNQNQERW